jgi:GntR family transcriptional regulator
MESLLLDAYRTFGDEHAPAYMNLRRAIRHTIESGAVNAGRALPGERELVQMLKLSRVTVRKAIEGLVEDGLLVQKQGAGTFVADRIVKSTSALTSFTDDLRARGLQPRSRFIERSVGFATPQEAMALNLSPGAGVTRLHRVRYADEVPLALEYSAIPSTILDNPNRVRHSLYEVLGALGYRPTRALQQIRAVAFTTGQAQLLDIAAGSPGLRIERRGFLADNRIVEFTVSYYRGDAYDFVAELRND